MSDRAVRTILASFAFAVTLTLARPAIVLADDAAIREQLSLLAGNDRAARREALGQLAAARDGRLVTFLESYLQSSVYRWQDRVVLCEQFVPRDGARLAPLADPLTREPLVDDAGRPIVVPAGDLKPIGPSTRDRRAVENAIRRLEIWSPDEKARLSAIQKFGDLRQAQFLEPLQQLIDADGVPERVRRKALESIALVRLGEEVGGQDPTDRLAAAVELEGMRSARAVPAIEELLKNLDPNHRDRRRYLQALETIESYQWKVSRVQDLFYGISAGSILVLVALGLAIIFGQMGVINMAHGELMMVGAYATYEIQLLFGHTPDNPVNWFFLAALPVSFLAAAGVGWLIEFLVVRHLYGRPLETLLATWAVGLILIQAARVKYGDNIGVNSPTWLVGSFEPIQDLGFSYNRIYILVLCATCVLLVYLLMNCTRRGMLIRATVQNRETAETLGVNTRRMDGFTFALGAGLAGVAGYAWTLIGGVTPNMGQNHIVGAFLVVVTGGVGELAGTIWAGMGIGMLTKLIEPIWGDARVAQVALLVLVIIFIQWKPAGLFPPKGRLADV